MSIDYTELDRLILASVAAGPGSPLSDSDCLDEADLLADKHGGDALRYIARRLMILSDAGVIALLRKEQVPNGGGRHGWYLLG